MYQIGICDDGKAFCSDMECMILNYINENKIEADISVWYSGEELCRSLQMGDGLDILFLDIELLEQNGIETAHFIRNRLEDREMQIIYVSAKTSYAQELFKAQPMDFLVKPVGQTQVNEALSLAIKLIRKDAVKFTFQKDRQYYEVPFGEILYFASEGREIKLITQNGENRFYGKLKDLARELSADFLPIHQSFIINRKYIIHYSYTEITLSNGCILPVSRSMRKEVRKKLLREDKWL